MHTMNHMILNDIDTIDDCMLEAEMNVLTALCDVYEKSAVILENYEGDDYSCFDIFQEGISDQLNKPVLGEKGENIIKRIILFIPRLLGKLFNLIRRLWDNRRSKQVARRIEELEKLNAERKAHLEELQKIYNDQLQNMEDDQMKTNAAVVELAKRDKQHSKDISDLHKHVDAEIKDVRIDVKRNSIENERLFAIIDTMNGVIKTHVNFEEVFNYYAEVTHVFDQLEKWNIYKPSTLSKECIEMMNRDIQSGRASDGHTWVLGTTEYRCKYTVFTNYIAEWSRRRDAVREKGEKLSNKISNMGQSYKTKFDTPNKLQSEQLNNVNLVMKYIQNVVKSAIACENIISSHLNHIDALLKKYQTYINPDDNSDV